MSHHSRCAAQDSVSWSCVCVVFGRLASAVVGVRLYRIWQGIRQGWVTAVQVVYSVLCHNWVVGGEHLQKGTGMRMSVCDKLCLFKLCCAELGCMHACMRMDAGRKSGGELAVRSVCGLHFESVGTPPAILGCRESPAQRLLAILRCLSQGMSQSV